MKKAAILSIGLLLFAVPWTARSGQAVSGPDPAPSGWRALGPTGGNVLSMAVTPQNGNEIFAVAGASTTQVLKSTDGGRNWTQISSINAQVYDIAVNPSNANLIYALYGSGVYRSSDRGATWTPSNFGSYNYTYNGCLGTNSADPNTIYASGYRYESSQGYLAVFKSTDGGGTWTYKIISGGASSVSVGGLAVFPTNPNIVYVSGGLYNSPSYAYRVYKTENGGASWQDVTGPINASPTALLFDPGSSQKVYAATLGKIYKTTNGGGAWTACNGYAYAYSLSIDPLNTNILYGAYDDQVYKSLDGGVNWASLTNGLKGTGNDVDVLPAGAGILFSSTTGIFRTTDGGTNWSSVSGGFCANNVQAIGFAPSAPGRVYANCVGNDLFKSDTFGASWATPYGEDEANSLTILGSASLRLDGAERTVYAKAENLNLKMRQLIREQQRKDLDDVMGIGQRRPTVRQAMKVLEDGGTRPVLAAYANRPKLLRGRYKGKLHRARVLRDGRIRYDGKTFNSPSLAAAAARGRPTANGWWFWTYQRAPGE